MEWTKEANQIFESHVRENQATWKKAGGNVAEVSDDLRGHVEESAHAAGAPVVDAECVSGVLGRFQLTWETETSNVLPLTGWGKVLSFIYLFFGVWLPLLFVGLVLRILLTDRDFYSWSIFRFSNFYDFPYLSHDTFGLAIYLLFIFLLVPVANWGVWRTIKYKMTDRKKAVEWLGGVAAVMSFVAMGIGFIFWHRLNFVQLVLVLIPLTAFAVLVRYSIYFTERLGTPLIYWKGIILGVILLFLPFGVTLGISTIRLAPALSTSHGLQLMKENNGPDSPGARWLRRWGSQKLLTDLYYNRGSWPSTRIFDSRLAPLHELNQKQLEVVYFQVYGVPVTQMALPNFLGPVDPNRGGENVGPLDPQISLIGSRLDVDVDTVVGVSLAQWTLEFENKGTDMAEARCEIVLPRDSVVTGASIWMNGKEVPAEFWARATARAAYEQVVRQRRDPLLITTIGQRRILVQCFPIQPRGERLKIRFSMSAPLEKDGSSGVYRAPVIENRNFVVPAPLQRSTYVEYEPKEPTKNRFILAAENAAPEKIIVQDSFLLKTPALPNPFDDRFSVVKQVVADDGPRERVIVVVDTSVSMEPHRKSLQQLLEKFPRPYTLVYPKNDLTAESAEMTPGRKPSFPETFSGGRDNYWALIKGWSLSLSNPRSALIWFHGPQPLLSYSQEIFNQQRIHGSHAPIFFDVPIINGPNIYLEKFQDLFQPEVLLWDESSRGLLADRLSELVSPHYSHNEVVYSTETYTKGTDSVSPWVSETIARLWAAQEIEKCFATDNRDQVEMLTRTYSILHRDSSAVALETMDTVQNLRRAQEESRWEAGIPTKGQISRQRSNSVVLEETGRSIEFYRKRSSEGVNRKFGGSFFEPSLVIGPKAEKAKSIDSKRAVSFGALRNYQESTNLSALTSVVVSAGGFEGPKRTIFWVLRDWVLVLLFLVPLVIAAIYFRSNRRAVRPVFRLDDNR